MVTQEDTERKVIYIAPLFTHNYYVQLGSIAGLLWSDVDPHVLQRSFLPKNILIHVTVVTAYPLGLRSAVPESSRGGHDLRAPHQVSSGLRGDGRVRALHVSLQPGGEKAGKEDRENRQGNKAMSQNVAYGSLNNFELQKEMRETSFSAQNVKSPSCSAIDGTSCS